MPLVVIRPAVPGDAAALVAIYNLFQPFSRPRTTEAFTQHLQELKGSDTGELTALVDERVVGGASFSQDTPGRFALWLHVHPDHQRSGIGRRLLHALEAAVAPLAPDQLSCPIPAHLAASEAFAQRMNFRLVSRLVDVALDLSAFEKTSRDAVVRLQAQGVSIVPLTTALDVVNVAALHQMYVEADADVPGEVQWANVDEASFRATLAGAWSPGSLVALEDARPVGVLLMHEIGERELYIDLTGTARSHRGRGIGFALKLLSAQAAKAAGYIQIRADTEHPAIMAINRKLGYTEQGAWAVYVKP